VRVEDVPKDIYNLLCSDSPPVTEEALEDSLERMAEAMKQAIREAVGPDQKRKGRLRLSGLGKQDRQLYNDYHGVAQEKLAGHTRMKFLFGHITEALLLALTEIAGHEVTEYQKLCVVNGIKGSQDCRIDGVLVDVKSASSYGFKKFRDGTMIQDDPFGYIAQIKGYAYQEGDKRYGWLAFDKQHGHITTLIVDEDKHPELQYCIAERAEEVKKLVEGDTIPSLCHEPVPDGNSGNMKLGIGCSYCGFKAHCFPELRTFLYSTGPRYLTEVSSEPRVPELLKEF
jgi:hypothetical protein